MAQRSGPPPIVFIAALIALLGGGYWFFFKRDQAPAPVATDAPVNTTQTGSNSTPTGTNTTISAAFPLPASVPAGTSVRIDGSTSMVTVNENLKQGFQRQFQGANVSTSAGGSDKGIQDLIAGKVEIAAVSRPLTSSEQAQGLTAVPIANDAIAVVVGKNNPFSGSLTIAEVSDIFQGKVNNWSAVGGTAGTIRVINRPAISGTNKSFQELILKGANFGTTPNIATLPRDATTPLLQALGTDGIGYATYAQVAKQQTVRVVPIDGLTPDSSSYPYQRTLYYVYKTPANPAVQAFIGYATSPQGQQALIGN
ncbi:phosphate ABC transporter substrate-binding protein [Dulcicalothrix desertica PCC 7102]|uniref:Phosphate ABC transporter substrate-binding protein n=1 Tax=Dulcicalothrix desertica PCC 7102 TaxID=232991 RepID=A0A3S1CWG4_9CYAN|nr:phosphate ABC transporter substrate-binding protein [Dulcicalothrix desertica]RUT10032.1 phosphate ABC transporter substrate-binding protein [Dulcicalothrix desertica PCC 7102]TWH40990.1 phosphate transport system substrate-binding protein [Dulcicalothrix desertica PCC 7102]